jgi:RelE toxin of RelE / RelB toxin-antitoxin system
MLNSVAETPSYSSQAAKLLSEHERIEVVNTIAANPTAGVLIPASGGLRKMRIGLEGRGKRGGGRVIYWYHSQNHPAVLLWVLAKNAASDLTPDQAKRVKILADSLLEDFGGSP